MRAAEIRENLLVGLDTLRSHKVRSGLTVLGIVIGVTSVISVAAINATKVLAQAKILGVPAARIGSVGGQALEIKAGGATLSCNVRELHDGWWNAIARAMR